MISSSSVPRGVRIVTTSAPRIGATGHVERLARQLDA